MLKKLLNWLTPWWSGSGVIEIYDSKGNLIALEPKEIVMLPRPKQGEVWALNGYEFLVGQVDYPYLTLYNVVRQENWAGHIKDAGDIYKVEETWLMKEVRKETKTLEEFIQLR